MRKHHPKNERVKHQYLAYLEEAKRLSQKSADIAAAAIADFEASTGCKDFAAFRIDQARRYKRVLEEAINPKTKKPLAKATINARLLAVKAFFFWLAGQPGYKSRITYSDCDYFNPSANDLRIGNAKRERPAPELDQVKKTIAAMPSETAIEKRNRAIIAFGLLTGARVDAMASTKIGHVDLRDRSVFQDAREVRTKGRKTMRTTFFPVGDELVEILADWIAYLKSEHGFTEADPLFPATKIEPDERGSFAASGFQRVHWSTANAIREIFRKAYANAGLPYFHPHSLRHTLAKHGERICRSPEEFKAWSQNMAHASVLTTYYSYGSVSGDRQARIIKALANRNESDAESSSDLDPETVAKVVAYLQKKAG